jgi:hypothetical protein
VGFHGAAADAKGLGDRWTSAQLHQRQQHPLVFVSLYAFAMTSGGLGCSSAALCTNGR